MKLNVLSIQGVVESHLCSGCGACASSAPDAIRMVDTDDQGRRPMMCDGANPRALRDAVNVCPGLGLSHERPPGGERASVWGPALEVWEGYAADPEIRFKGSSGGITSALAVYCIEQGGMHGVVHTAAREDVPYLNQTVLSTTRGQVLARAGSRYAPASPADGLGRIEQAPGACVFVGKPCDVAGAARLARQRVKLGEKLGLTIAFFCAGTPTTRGTLEMLRAMGIKDPSDVASLRYRGHGWPGEATAGLRSGAPSRRMSYEDAWGKILTRHKQWRCNLCADHTGEFADIAVGDAWHRHGKRGDPGRSIVVVRTERGRRVLHAAMAGGAVVLEPSSVGALKASQPSLLRTRGAVWGRIAALRAIGLQAPRYQGMPMARLWWSELSLGMKIRSIVGTWRRVMARGLARPSVTRARFDGAIVEPKVGVVFEHGATPCEGARS